VKFQGYSAVQRIGHNYDPNWDILN